MASIQPPVDELSAGGDALVELLNSLEVADPGAAHFEDAGRRRFRAARVPEPLIEELNAGPLVEPAAPPSHAGACAADYWRIEGHTVSGDRVFYAVDGCRFVTTWAGRGRDVPEVRVRMEPGLERALSRLRLEPAHTVPSHL